MTSKDINTGGPAFPFAGLVTPNGIAFEGMTLRDYFAAKAMQGILAADTGSQESRLLAKEAYLIADSMLRVRND